MNNRFKRINTKEVVITKQFSTKHIYDIYLNDVQKFDLLTTDEEVELFKKIENGCKASIDEIYTKNLKFVISVATKYASLTVGTCLTLEDLISEGNLGMHKAILKFDHTRGFKFISYAVDNIRASILLAFGNYLNQIRIPQSMAAKFSKIKKTENELQQTLHHEPQIEEIVNSLLKNYSNIFLNYKSTILDVIDYHTLYKPILSYNDPGCNHVTKNEEFNLLDVIRDDSFITPDTNVTSTDLNKHIFKRFEEISMPNTIKNYFIDFFGLNGEGEMSYSELSIKYGEARKTIVNRMESYMRKIRILDRKAPFKLKELMYND